MDDIKKILSSLISISDNIHRTELYKNFYNVLQNVISEKENDTLNRIHTNLSGLIAHSEINNVEYDLLKLLLQHFEKII